MIQAQNVNDVIDHLAAKLAVPVSHLWAVLIRQTRIDAIQALVFAALTIGFGVWWRRYSRGKDALDDPGVAITGIALAFASLFAIVWLFIAVGEIVNPEYYALKMVVEAASK